jgi:hypothetical protein
MQFGQESKESYFSVTYSTAIGLMKCVPQVCYRLPEDIRATVEEMEGLGLAKIYREEVRFVSGSPVPIKKPASQEKPLSSAPGKAPGVPGLAKAVESKKRRGGGREFD